MEERSQFLCGVVEGFYGRPWSMDQRRILFQWMQHWGLNTYLTSSSPPPCDLTLLKRKLKQVSDLGCEAFAILFDDIDHSMCQADSEAFSSFAHAQVSVANEIYRFLGEPSVFLFCPTEYCGSLCSPCVSKSSYLQTLGADLQPNISVIWTGSKVISRTLSVDCLEEVGSVLQRPPLIWDNLHANDYDSRRLFLGPFKGREPQLRRHLRGLLLNPNCEFEANYIPLHTLGTWHRTPPGGEGGDDEPEYCPDSALSEALRDWMDELNQPLQPEHHAHLPRQDPRPGRPPPAQAKPLPMFPLSSGSPPTSPAKGGENGSEGEAKRPPGEGLKHKAQGRVPCGGKGLLSEAQVRLLVGLHYLPHEHGPAAQRLLQDLTWLKSNCHLVSLNGKKTAQQKVEEWRGRASRLMALCEDIAELPLQRGGRGQPRGAVRPLPLRLGPEEHRAGGQGLRLLAGRPGSGGQLHSGLLEELLPLVWDDDGGGATWSGFGTVGVQGRGLGGSAGPTTARTRWSYTVWCDSCTSEPRGGKDSNSTHPDVTGDRCLGACLALCPEYSFVMEDELGVCGCVTACRTVRAFIKRCHATWMPAMRDKYPGPGPGPRHCPRTHRVSRGQGTCSADGGGQGEYPDSLLHHFPSQLRLDALPQLVDASVSRTLLTALLAALKANGSQGVFCEVQPTDRQRMEFLTKLGFLEILRGEARSREGVVLGRLL
ncbi:unnamed protein product [Gadus morhua 'NCC']